MWPLIYPHAARVFAYLLLAPTAQFYRKPVLGMSQWFRALGYNNLLGFPYLTVICGSFKAPTSVYGLETVATFSTSRLTPRIEGEDYGAAKRSVGRDSRPSRRSARVK